MAVASAPLPKLQTGTLEFESGRTVAGSSECESEGKRGLGKVELAEVAPPRGTGIDAGNRTSGVKTQSEENQEGASSPLGHTTAATLATANSAAAGEEAELEKPEAGSPQPGTAAASLPESSADTNHSGRAKAEGKSHVSSDADKTRKDLYTSFFEAVSQNNIDKVKELVKKGCKVNKGWKFKTDRGKWTTHTTALEMAVANGADKLLQFLISAGADVDKVTYNYSENLQQTKTALSMACNCRQMYIMKLLVEGGADVNQINRTEKLREEEGGLISYGDPENRLLHCGANQGDYPISKQLLDIGADPLITNKRKKTPLHIACDHFYVDIIKLLLQSGGMTYQMDYQRNSQMWRLINSYAGDELRELCTMFVMAGYDAALDGAVTRTWVTSSGELRFPDNIHKFIVRKGVMSLKQLCRLQIRSQLGRLKLQLKIDSMEEVPKQLRDYLALRIL